MNDKFSARIKVLRREKKLTQEELAVILKVDKSTISKYENGVRFPDEEMLNTIKDYFDVTFDYLLGLSDKRNSKVDLLAENPQLFKEHISRDRMKELGDFLISKGYMESFNKLKDNELEFLKSLLESYLKSINNTKIKSED